VVKRFFLEISRGLYDFYTKNDIYTESSGSQKNCFIITLDQSLKQTFFHKKFIDFIGLRAFFHQKRKSIYKIDYSNNGLLFQFNEISKNRFLVKNPLVLQG
jgi:hypothetical protein